MATIREPHAEVEFTTPVEPFDEATPELVSCIVARCNQVVEIQNSDGSVNAEAQSSTPAILLFNDGPTWLAENNDNLVLRAGNGVLQTMTFKDVPAPKEFLTGSYTAQYLKDAFERAYVGLSARIVNASTVMLYTDASGDNAKIEIVSQNGDMFSEVVPGMVEIGYGAYSNQKVLQLDYFLPDPRSLGDNKKVDSDTVRVFVRRNNAFIEFDDESALMLAAKSIAKTTGVSPYDDKAFSLAAVDDPDLDNYTPWVASEPIQAELIFDGIEYTVLPTAITDAGSTAIGSVGNVFTITIQNTPGPNPMTVVVTPATDNVVIDINGQLSITDKDTFVAALLLNATFNALFNAEVLSGGAVFPTLTTVPLSLEGYDAHNWASLTGGTAPSAVEGALDISGGHDFTLTPKQINFSFQGGRVITVVLNQNFADDVAIVAALNAAVIGDDPFSSVARDINQDGVMETVLKVSYTPVVGQLYGRDSSVKIWGTGVVDLFGPNATYVSTFFGRPHSVDYGDEVWADGAIVGTVVGFADYVSGDYTIANGILILDTEVSTSFSKAAWYIKAKNLQPTDITNVRPQAMLYLDQVDDWYILKDNVITDYAGQPVETSNVIYIGYTALRKDISDDIIVYEKIDVLESELAPISVENPFGLMMYLTLSESEGQQVTGIAVNDFTETEPDGTETAYAYALEVLTSKDVNRIVSGSLRQEVNEMFDAHGAEMFAKEHSRGRLMYIAEQLPDEAPPTVLGSGNANSLGGNNASVLFDSNTVVVEDVIRDAGIDPASLTIDSGVFLRVPWSTEWYVVKSVSGQTVVVQTSGFQVGDNDGSWSTEPFPALIDQICSIFLRGDAITDRDDEIEALGLLASHYEWDGTHFIQPSSFAATLYGIDYLLDNRYLAAVVAGASSRYRASKSLNGMQLNEANAVFGSNDRYSQEQLNVGQGSGIFWVENYRGATQVRMQLTVTTERSNIIAAKAYLKDYWRIIFKDYFRMEEMSSQLQENLSTKIEGGVQALLRGRICKKFDFLRLATDPNDPRGLIGYADCELFQPFEKFTFEIKLI